MAAMARPYWPISPPCWLASHTLLNTQCRHWGSLVADTGWATRSNILRHFATFCDIPKQSKKRQKKTKRDVSFCLFLSLSVSFCLFLSLFVFFCLFLRRTKKRQKKKKNELAISHLAGCQRLGASAAEMAQGLQAGPGPAPWPKSPTMWNPPPEARGPADKSKPTQHHRQIPIDEMGPDAQGALPSKTNAGH